jgi:hypothetical protein
VSRVDTADKLNFRQPGGGLLHVGSGKLLFQGTGTGSCGYFSLARVQVEGLMSLLRNRLVINLLISFMTPKSALLGRLLRSDMMVTRQLPFSASALVRRSLLGTWRAQKSLGITARLYSTARLQGLDASQLSITKTTTPKELVPPEELIFGHTFTDHMLSCEWTASQGTKLEIMVFTLLRPI